MPPGPINTVYTCINHLLYYDACANTTSLVETVCHCVSIVGKPLEGSL